MSRWDDSTGTVLYLPDGAALTDAGDILASLGEVSIRVAQGEWNNPIAWLDKGKGAFLRLQAHHPRAPQWPDWGGIDWDNVEQADAVLGLAEALALRTYNRWYAVCDYEGWDDACTTVVEVPSFEAFRALLAETDSREVRKGPHRDDRYRLHPGECQVYKVQGPAWSGG